jgi:hypothetical protein
MPDAIRLPPQPDTCELCRRKAPLTRHHLIPKSLHDKPYVQKRFGRTERITATLWVCRPCHNHIHATFDEKELALTITTVSASWRMSGYVRLWSGCHVNQTALYPSDNIWINKASRIATFSQGLLLRDSNNP